MAGAAAAGEAEARLRRYRERRDFARTAEPSGAAAIAPGGDRYAIQLHEARRRHFDLRLELDGVLLSWAITRGPSPDPAARRLAVRTEDHPLDYADFEGTIPAGQYGAGTVMLWDTGRWEPEGDPRAGLAKGRLRFTLHGERLKGGWSLVRMAPKEGEKRENWLLIKARDAWAEEGEEPDRRHVTSVASGRDMAAIAGGVARPPQPQPKPKGGRAAAMPGFVPPALATLVEAAPTGAGWLHEIKWDGYRAQAALADGRVVVRSRSGADWTERFAPLVPSLARLAARQALIDGEVVALDDGGRSDFATLQAALSGDGPMILMAFDLLRLDGEDLRGRPLAERKERLRGLIPDGDPALRYCDHVEGDGGVVQERACALGLEGVISKRADGRYRSGRHRGWQKSKCLRREEVVIGGYRPSRAVGRPFSSLLVGTWEADGLAYRGRVGTGFDAARLGALAERLGALRRPSSPFAEVPDEPARDAHWVAPELVAEVSYTERTADGLLRHPVFLGLREDKPAREVRLERPAPAAPSERPARPGKRPTAVGRVRLTSPDKILYGREGITKATLAGYVEAVAPLMLPHAAGRPLTLVRCPQGRAAKCFYQRHHQPGLPPGLHPLAAGGGAALIRVDDADGLVSTVQAGVLEVHVWGSRAADLERPDRLVFDLDPATDVPFAAVREAAQHLRRLLAAAELESFPMLTGGKGIHVVVPLAPVLRWPAVKAVARGLARAMAAAEPDRFIARAALAARGGRIFVDWLRNDRSATAICPYSARARVGAPVAMPVSWAGLARAERSDAYTVETAPAHIARRRADPWAGYFDIDQTIAPGTLRLFGADAGETPRRPAMARKHGKRIKDDETYEALRDEGASKEKAARIANARANKGQHPSRKGGESASYEDWTKKDLYQRAREIGIEDRSKMSKSQLIHALRHH